MNLPHVKWGYQSTVKDLRYNNHYVPTYLTHDNCIYTHPFLYIL